MNELALKMDTRKLQQALQLVDQFKAGHWESPVIRAIPEGDPRFKLGGIVFGTKTPLAVINGKTPFRRRIDRDSLQVRDTRDKMSEN